MTFLEKAIQIAIEAHSGQIQKNGQPYILHPLHVMMQVNSLEEKAAAVLHDVVEDTNWSIEKLEAAGIPHKVIQAVDLLTKKDGLSYEDYLGALSTSATAIEVKLADLKHNMDILRLDTLRDEDLDRIKKYHHSYHYLSQIRSTLSDVGKRA